MKRIKRLLVLTQFIIALERGLRCFWPALTVAFLAFTVFVFTSDYNPALSFIAIGALVYFFWKGMKVFRWPDQNQARRRLDAINGNGAFTALEDKNEIGNSELWQLHQKRLFEKAQAAALPQADLRLAKYDPWGTRLVAGFFALIAVAIFLFGGQYKGLQSADAAQIPENLMSFDGWIEPPAYTGRPDIYLNKILSLKELEVPEGSLLTIRSYGKSASDMSYSSFANAIENLEIGPNQWEQTIELHESGILKIDRDGKHYEWSISTLEDLPPSVTIEGDIERDVKGNFSVAYRAEDDYGIENGYVVIDLDLAQVDRRYGLEADPDPQEPLKLPIKAGLSKSDAKSIFEDNLSDHLWVNLPVKIKFLVEDGASQLGESSILETHLEGRRFFNPRAIAMLEQRRDILWAKSNRDRVSKVLRALVVEPDQYYRKYEALKFVLEAITFLESDTAEWQTESAKALWEAAQLFEDSSLEDALARLQEAKEKLAEAIKNGASKEEIERLMEEMREALDNYMNELAKQSPENQGDQSKQDQLQMSGEQLQELLDKLQELMENGQTDEAMQLLEQLQELLENMEVTQSGEGKGQQSQNGMSEELGETMRDQQGLSDELFDEMQRQFEEGSETNQQSFSQRQQNLKDRLNGLRDALPDSRNESGDRARDALSNAEREMEKAGRNLEEGDLREALENQAGALENMREAMRELESEERTAQTEQSGENGQTDAQGRENSPGNPLGEQYGARGAAKGGNPLPEELEKNRLYELGKEIERRLSEQRRSENERDYLKRLIE